MGYNAKAIYAIVGLILTFATLNLLACGFLQGLKSQELKAEAELPPSQPKPKYQITVFEGGDWKTKFYSNEKPTLWDSNSRWIKAKTTTGKTVDIVGGVTVIEQIAE